MPWWIQMIPFFVVLSVWIVLGIFGKKISIG